MDKKKIYNMGVTSIVCAIFCFIAACIMSGVSTCLAAIIGVGFTVFGAWLLWQVHKIQPKDDATPKANESLRVPTTAVEYVFVTNHGAKFHKDPCCSGNINMQRISKTAAIKKGYNQCKRCQYF